jgi:hypothetical protein
MIVDFVFFISITLLTHEDHICLSTLATPSNKSNYSVWNGLYVDYVDQ